jgi:PHP family Zn ribbon phosphoesterase
VAELRYFNCDLHVHTPGSKCFTDKRITPREIVEASLNAGLDAIAITDHNTGEWVDRVKKAAEGSGLVVFPGVEITCGAGGEGGIHVIAIFQCEADGAAVGNLLGALGIPSGDYGSETAISPRSVLDVIGQIADHGALPVLAQD